MSNQYLKKISSNLNFVYSDNNSISVIFKNNDLLMGVVGEFNNNIKYLEKITNTNIYSRGNSILVKSVRFPEIHNLESGHPTPNLYNTYTYNTKYS